MHSGDSACTLPPATLAARTSGAGASLDPALAQRIGVRGLMNIQFALAHDVLYVLEANPRASRTVPFVAKATGVPLAKAAARSCSAPRSPTLREEACCRHRRRGDLPTHAHLSVRRPCCPSSASARPTAPWLTPLGPEMRSTGEVMGIDMDFGAAFARARPARCASCRRRPDLRLDGHRDKRAMIFPIMRLKAIWASPSSPPSGPQMSCGAMESRPRWCAIKVSERGPGETSIVDHRSRRHDRHGGQHPPGRTPREDGYKIRQPPRPWTSRSSRPCSNSVRPCRGIESAIHHELRVRVCKTPSRSTSTAGGRGRRRRRCWGPGHPASMPPSAPVSRAGDYRRADAGRPRSPLATPGQFVARGDRRRGLGPAAAGPTRSTGSRPMRARSRSSSPTPGRDSVDHPVARRGRGQCRRAARPRLHLAPPRLGCIPRRGGYGSAPLSGWPKARASGSKAVTPPHPGRGD